MITTATIKGPRYTQEDRFVVADVPEGKLLAVMDGHGGVDVAKFVATHLVDAWKVESEQAPDDDIEMLMKNVVNGLHQCTKDEEAGSTLSMVLIPKSEKVAYVAILGDSPVIVRQPNGTLHISPDHNVRSNQAEEQAAILRGAFIAGGYMCAEYGDLAAPGIQMTRVLGDRALDRVIDRTPEVYSAPLGDFVLLGSDGLFDPAHKASAEEQTCLFTVMIDRGDDAKDIVSGLEEPRDNVTAILWKRDPLRTGTHPLTQLKSIMTNCQMAAYAK